MRHGPNETTRRTSRAGLVLCLLTLLLAVREYTSSRSDATSGASSGAPPDHVELPDVAGVSGPGGAAPDSWNTGGPSPQPRPARPSFRVARGDRGASEAPRPTCRLDLSWDGPIIQWYTVPCGPVRPGTLPGTTSWSRLGFELDPLSFLTDASRLRVGLWYARTVEVCLTDRDGRVLHAAELSNAWRGENPGCWLLPSFDTISASAPGHARVRVDPPVGGWEPDARIEVALTETRTVGLLCSDGGRIVECPDGVFAECTASGTLGEGDCTSGPPLRCECPVLGRAEVIVWGGEWTGAAAIVAHDRAVLERGSAKIAALSREGGGCDTYLFRRQAAGTLQVLLPEACTDELVDWNALTPGEYWLAHEHIGLLGPLFVIDADDLEVTLDRKTVADSHIPVCVRDANGTAASRGGGWVQDSTGWWIVTLGQSGCVAIPADPPSQAIVAIASDIGSCQASLTQLRAGGQCVVDPDTQVPQWP